MNKWDQMREALDDAEATLRVADYFIDRLARFLISRLRHVHSHDTLKRLKRELGEYNAHTREWKS